MDRDEAELLAAEVRKATNQTSPPIDVLQIAREERIVLAPGEFGPEFDARIEYHQDPGKFLLFFPAFAEGRSEARIRFSVAHELGHYYIPEHRKLLIGGRAHNSTCGFICDNCLEREADQFAACLLVPREALADFCWHKRFFTLKELVDLAGTWRASATSTAIRYTQWTSECCAVLLSMNGIVRCYIPSDDAAYRGFQWLGNKRVSPKSATMMASAHQGSGRFFERESNTNAWFSERKASHRLWEEAFPLGYTQLVLTMLTFEVDDCQ
jgi:hypothetical protein